MVLLVWGLIQFLLGLVAIVGVSVATGPPQDFRGLVLFVTALVFSLGVPAGFVALALVLRRRLAGAS